MSAATDRLDARARRAITQRTGARVYAVSDEQTGVVVGHYDDDIVFVRWDVTGKTERHYTEDLRLAPAAPGGEG